MRGKHHPEEVKRKISYGVKNSDYWLSVKGKSFDEIRGLGVRVELSKKMKGTFTLNWFIQRYGNIIGKKKYSDRAKQLSEKSYFKIYNALKNKNNYSNKSQKLFWVLFNELQLDKNKTYFGELNHEYSCGVTHRNFDFVCLDRKKAIEFNGDKFHANPSLYTETDCPNPYRTKLTSKEIWDFDKQKLLKASNNGFNILIVWEADYDKDPQAVIRTCLDFLI